MTTPSNYSSNLSQSNNFNKGKLQYPLFNTSNVKNKIVSIKLNQINKTVVDEKDLINERKSSFNALASSTTNLGFTSNKYSSFNKKLQIDLKKPGKIIIPSILSNKKEGEIQAQTTKNINKLNNFVSNPIIDLSMTKTKLEQFRNNSSIISLNNNNQKNSNEKQVNNTKLSSINESSNIQSFNLNLNTSNTSQSNSKDLKIQISSINPPSTSKNTTNPKNLFNNSITSFTNNTLINQYFSGKKVRHTSIRLNPPPNKTLNDKLVNFNNSNSINNVNSISESSIGCEKNSKNKANNDSHLFHSVRLIDSDFHIFKDKNQEKISEKVENNKYDKYENKNDAIPSLKRKLLLNNPTAKKAPTKLFISEKLIDSEFNKDKDQYKSPTNNLNSKDKESSFNDKDKPFLLNSAKKTTKITKINLDSNNKSCFSLRSDSKKDSNNKAKSYSTMSWEYSDKDKDKSNQHNSYVIQAKNIINKQNSNSMSYAKIVDKLSASLSSESFNLRQQDSNNKAQEVKCENKRAFNLKSTIGLVRKKNNTNKTLNLTNSELISYSIKK
jgi:hypothetical protein